MPSSDSQEQISLNDAASHLLDECRMVLPGIQALFGFQLIAFFNQAFGDKLSHREQTLHLAATVAVACAVALVMTPAALHRQAQPMAVSERFVNVASRFLLCSMLPLALGISLDVYLVSRMVLKATAPAAVIAAVLFAGFGVLWYAVPRNRRLRRLATGM